jgi:hypothetical protein
MAAKKKAGTLVDTAAIGSLGGAARAANMSAKERQQSARNAIKARWEAYYQAHPEKLQARHEREAKRSATKQKTLTK